MGEAFQYQVDELHMKYDLVEIRLELTYCCHNGERKCGS
jgi:hypothetical protein